MRTGNIIDTLPNRIWFDVHWVKLYSFKKISGDSAAFLTFSADCGGHFKVNGLAAGISHDGKGIWLSNRFSDVRFFTGRPLYLMERDPEEPKELGSASMLEDLLFKEIQAKFKKIREELYSNENKSPLIIQAQSGRGFVHIPVDFIRVYGLRLDFEKRIVFNLLLGHHIEFRMVRAPAEIPWEIDIADRIGNIEALSAISSLSGMKNFKSDVTRVAMGEKSSNDDFVAAIDNVDFDKKTPLVFRTH